MKKIVHKFYWAWQADEEEIWLNEMANEGWALCDVGWCKYTLNPVKRGNISSVWNILQTILVILKV